MEAQENKGEKPIDVWLENFRKRSVNNKDDSKKPSENRRICIPTSRVGLKLFSEALKEFANKNNNGDKLL